MTTWITSDTHWGHNNIMKFCPDTRARFRNDVAFMNETMIKEWNELIGVDDTVYLLGDFAFLPAKDAVQILRRLNGTKILIEGNHDRKLLNDPAFRAEFKEVHQYHEIVYEGTKVCMFHYPIFDHNGAGRGSIMLHGHRHGNPHNIPGKIMDVGMDATGKIVTLLDDVINQLKDVPHMYHHAPSTN